MEKAESLLSKGATAEAVVVLRQIVMDDPGNVDAHLRWDSVGPYREA